MINIYADTLFLINFIVNIILLKITSLFLKESPKASRLTFGASIGGIYALGMFFPSLSFLYIFPFKILISTLMIKIISPKAGALKLLKYTAVFFLVSFTFAGVLMALIGLGYFGGKNPPLMKNGIVYFDISLSKLCLASLICFAVISLSLTIFKRNKSIGIKRLEIFLSGAVCEMTALSDSGNLLCDPISQTPVIIAEERFLNPLFTGGIKEIISGQCDNVKIRMIPYSSLGKSDGMLMGFIPDRVLIDGRRTKDVIVAISPQVLSQKDEYNALFNPNILLV